MAEQSNGKNVDKILRNLTKNELFKVLKNQLKSEDIDFRIESGSSRGKQLLNLRFRR